MDDFIIVTDAALEFMRKSVDEEKCLGVRINIGSGGCQGMTYELDYVYEEDPADVLLTQYDVKIYVAPRAVLFAAGMVVDYKKTPMGGNITFENPNAKACCGCGKSFRVDENGCGSGGCCSC